MTTSQLSVDELKRVASLISDCPGWRATVSDKGWLTAYRGQMKYVESPVVDKAYQALGAALYDARMKTAPQAPAISIQRGSTQGDFRRHEIIGSGSMAVGITKGEVVQTGEWTQHSPNQLDPYTGWINDGTGWVCVAVDRDQRKVWNAVQARLGDGVLFFVQDASRHPLPQCRPGREAQLEGSRGASQPGFFPGEDQAEDVEGGGPSRGPSPVEEGPGLPLPGLLRRLPLSDPGRPPPEQGAVGVLHPGTPRAKLRPAPASPRRVHQEPGGNPTGLFWCRAWWGQLNPGLPVGGRVPGHGGHRAGV
jgi:hypothetical protein